MQVTPLTLLTDFNFLFAVREFDRISSAFCAHCILLLPLGMSKWSLGNEGSGSMSSCWDMERSMQCLPLGSVTDSTGMCCSRGNHFSCPYKPDACPAKVTPLGFPKQHIWIAAGQRTVKKQVNSAHKSFSSPLQKRSLQKYC